VKLWRIEERIFRQRRTPPVRPRPGHRYAIRLQRYAADTLRDPLVRRTERSEEEIHREFWMMHIISRKRLNQFARRFPETRNAFASWYHNKKRPTSARYRMCAGSFRRRIRSAD